MFGEVFGDADEVIGDDACLGLEGGPCNLLAGLLWGLGWWFARTIAGEGRFGLGLRLESPGSGLAGRAFGEIARGLLSGLG